MSLKMQPGLSRRAFMANSAVAGSTLCATTVLHPHQSAASEQAVLAEGTIVLCQGDSITDAGRDRKAAAPNDAAGLGRGYPFFLAGSLLADHAKSRLKVLNRGVSGNKVPDLAARWQDDAIALKPHILSILIGVNDIWHKINGRYNATVEEYESGYRQLLTQSIQAIPGVRLVVCEPFVLHCGAVNDKWFPEFDQRRAAAKKIADDMGLTFVPFQSMFDDATRQAPPEYWAGDGVHPTIAGHALMAKTWRAVVGI